MKKQLVVVVAAACVSALVLAGCASNQCVQSSQETSSSNAAFSSAASSSSAGMPNPRSDVSSAQEAAAGAGMDSFGIPAGAAISLGTVEDAHTTYRCMEGIAQADVDFPAVALCIRKGTGGVVVEGDVSGDYNEYAYTWTESVDGQELTCSGNREGESTKTIWTSGDYSYCILATGLGGDTDYGLSADDLAILVPAIR